MEWKFYKIPCWEIISIIKDYIFQLGGANAFIRKTTIIMRLIIILLLTSIFTVHANGFTQSITVSKKNVTLKEVFQTIKSQTKLDFFYDKAIIDDNERISIRFTNATLNEVLAYCLADKGISYTIKNNAIILRRDNKEDFQQNEKNDEVVIPPLITGRITDSLGRPLSGATITVKGTDKKTMTDENGNFSIDVTPGAVLEVSMVGYRTKDVTVDNSSSISIVLSMMPATLDQVVVIGYGTQKQRDITGSVGIVKPEKNLQARPATNVQELLAGAVPGLNISKGSGAVGSGASLNIRGTSTIGPSSGVLVLIDGVPGNIYTLNPNDIESISVLKDAAAAAIYGSRAANGVMLVTTKTAKGVTNGKPAIDISSSVGLQNPQHMLDFVGSEDFMKMWDQALINDGKPALYGDQGIADLKAGKYADNKWYKEIYNKNTVINNNYLAISGKTDYVTYRLSGAYDYQNGNLPNNTYNRFIIRPNIGIKITKNLTLEANVQYTQTKILQPQGGTTGWQSQASRISPTDFIYNSQGEYASGSPMAGNPIAGVNDGGYNVQNVKEMLNIFDLTYTPLKNWNIKANYSNYTYDGRSTDKVNSYKLYNMDGSLNSTQNSVNQLTESSENNKKNILQLTTNYSINSSIHSFKVMAGYSQEYNKWSSFNASRQNFLFDGLDALSLGTTNKQNDGTLNDYAIQSFFARMNYDFDGKYLFQANIRADGSSMFGPGHRWGYFPSFSAGWNINNENFMKDVSWISQLKLRASWGMLGDALKAAYVSSDATYYASATVLNFSASNYGFNGAMVPGAWNGVVVDPNISWEKASVGNIGIDAAFLNQKLMVTIEAFRNVRSGILTQRVVPTEFGLSKGPWQNLMKMQSHGVEGLVSYNDKAGKFSWGIDVNAGFSRNKVLDMAGTGPWPATQVADAYVAEGLPYGLPYGLQAIGFFKSDDDVTKSPSQGSNIFPGNIKYKDVKADGIINGDDRVIFNKNVVPVNYGSNIRFGWKNIDFSANVYGVINTWRAMTGYEVWAFFLTQNARPMAKNSWTTDNPNATYPRLSIQYTSNDTKYSSFWLQKFSYLKLQNIQVGYALPHSLLEKAKISYLRLYLSAQNLATITGYKGFDPEGGWYPLSRTISFGVNLKF